MTYRFTDCQGFAGAMSVGATQAGLKLVAKLEKPGGFGLPLMEANRRFLGDAWEAQVTDPFAWEPVSTDVVVGTPPCSAFSGMSVGTDKHGVDSTINECMRDLINYAARVRPAAVVMESVYQAYSQGITLMSELADTLQTRTRLAYRTTHVVQDNWALGGCTRRKRYFLVLSQVPFGVERHEPRWLANVGDAFEDLRGLKLTWDQQAHVRGGTWWSTELRNVTGTVDGHEMPAHNAYYQRILDLTGGDRAVPWHPGEDESSVLRRFYETHGELPESWRYDSASRSGLGHLTRDKQLIERDFNVGGFSRPRHWDWSRPGRVVTGAGPWTVWHPDGRFITHRECARLMGFPDDWLIAPAKDASGLGSFWGKGTSVHPAHWVLTWLRRSLDGNPGSLVGQALADGSHVVDVSRDGVTAARRFGIAA